MRNPTFDDKGMPIVCYHITDDLSFPIKKGIAINNRVNKEELPTLQYGLAFLRTLHHLHSIRQHNLQGVILVNKQDLKDAYWRMHTWAHIAAACMILVKELVLLLLRLPFGSSPARENVLSSEMMVDFANDLLANNTWTALEFPIPYRQMIQTPKLSSPPSNPILALPLDVPVAYRLEGGCKGYVDDMWTVVLQAQGFVERVNVALYVAIQATFCPVAQDEPFPRLDPTSQGKLQAEGRMEETKTILGWVVDTRAHMVSLPQDKSKEWKASIHGFLCSGCASPREFKKLAGKLNRVSAVLPPARHFGGRIYRIAQDAKENVPQVLPKEVLEDLELWLIFLQSAQRGVSINTLVFRAPQVEIASDTCEHGIGGYTSEGFYWRLELPDRLI